MRMKTSATMEHWLTAKQAAIHMGCSVATVYQLVRKKKLRASKITGSRDLRFRREWLDEWLCQTTTIPLAMNQ